MKSLIASLLVAVMCVVNQATAQQSSDDIVWVQIEAHPSLATAQSRARSYAAELADVNGFALGGGWYAIALGPYRRSDANQVLRVYRAERQIPRDSYIAESRAYRQQYWPVGANVLNRGVVEPPAATSTQEAAPDPEPEIAETPAPPPSDETRAEARQSERLLNRDERRELQTALKSQGFYTAAIDGAFGSGTRRSMSEWQAANGYEVTGILTTAQRRALIDQYNAPLISVGMAIMQDSQAGIEMQMPLNEVRFDQYEPPFAQYNATGDLGARVLLISQPGDQATLFGLYDIMQTLEIVPLNGARDRKRDRFSIEGRNDKIVSYTEARLINGEIKGFTLIWPTGDDERRQRVLAEMQASFVRLPGVLDPAAGAANVQDIDLVSGLEVRKPRVSRSGFYIDGSGTVVTTAEAVQNCARITLDDEYEAQVVTSDPGLGVAVLRPAQPLAPISVARFSPVVPRLKSEIAVSGYSYEGLLGGPTMTFGTLSDVKGLRGETELKRLALNALPGDIGGPVFDAGGGVMGMLLPQPDTGKRLPADVSFAAGAESIRNVLDVAGVAATENAPGGLMAPEDLTRLASGMTVLVSCWD